MAGCTPGPKERTQPGDKFFRLTAISRIGSDHRGSNLRWLFRCECGNETAAVVAHVRNGHKKSCGCYAHEVRTEVGKRVNLKHGKARRGNIIPEYIIWQGMIARCENPKSISFKNYGGRGISVQEPFRSSFDSFLAEVGPRPSPSHSIDRIDNDGNYAPGNVRWATRLEQSKNKKRKCS